MAISEKLLRTQLSVLSPFMDVSPLEWSRTGQDKIGRLMHAIRRSDVRVQDQSFPGFEGAWVIPVQEERFGVILYLHGGGYTCGSLEYTKGFASVLAATSGMRVLCCAYRLAPEYPYPAALDDAEAAYCELLRMGYEPAQIVFCGESAGGGLEYCLCLRLREAHLPMPCGIIAISPWTDLTMSGASYTENRERDPSMTVERLQFFADCYTGQRHDLIPQDKKLTTPTAVYDPKDPMISPLYGDLTGFPPSLIISGGDEIMLSDASDLCERLHACGCECRHIVTPNMWHAYVLYGMSAYTSDYDDMRTFIDTVLPPGSHQTRKWMKLDNAAKIYPASASRRWTNVFRLSATLTEPIEARVLQSALDVTVRRFPSMAVRLRRGMFWYYLEQIGQAPRILPEKSYPLAHMPFDDIRTCAFRVLVYENRIAVEFFHAVTDGNGALVFLKTLVAEYCSQRYGAIIPCTDGVKNRLEIPNEAELEDDFPKYAAAVRKSRREPNSFRIMGKPEADGFLHDTVFLMDVEVLQDAARARGVTITSLLAAAMLVACARIQEQAHPRRRGQKPVRLVVPVNLRRMFAEESLRNFVYYVSPGYDPRLGEYSFDEVASQVYHQLRLDASPKEMASRIATNVHDEQLLSLRIMPLFVKNLAMKAIFHLVGERKSVMCFSNLGPVALPDEMKPFCKRFDFIIGAQATAPYNCALLSYGDTLYLHLVRNVREPILERMFFEVLREVGIHPKVESNDTSERD